MRSSAKAQRSVLAASVAMAVAALGAMWAGSGVAAATSGSATTGTLAVPVDRQDYVTAATHTNPQDGSTVDPYDADASSIHVAINGGNEFARSFVHLALDYLPDGAQATQATLTMHVTQQSDASSSGVYQAYNVNTSQAIVEACALVTELPANFDYTHPPAYDCAHGSAIGKANAALDTWTFDLRDLLAYWKLHGNTGAALIPVGSGDPTQTWGVAFYRSRSSASVAYAIPAVVTAPTTPPVSHVGVAVTPPTTGTGVVPPTPVVVSSPPSFVSSPMPVSSPSVAAVAPAPSPAATSTGGGSSPVWPWVLLASIALAAGSLGWAHRAEILASLPKGLAAYRTHPRAYTVATAALSWGLVFSGYSAVTQPDHHAQNLAGDQQPVTTTPNTPGTVNGQAPHTNGTSPTAGPVTSGPAGGPSQLTGSSPSPVDLSAQAAATEFSGAGTYRVINGVRVFFPANGGPPVASLYHGADDVIGIDNKTIELCAHAALTYGSAFNITASDLDVYWDWVRDHGGIYGRTVHTDYENDNYDPSTAVQAAQKCKDLNTFMLLGGIGFDQIPAVRQWAEQNHVLYYHHIATIEGSDGLRYSYSPLPTVEQMGTFFGQLAVQRFPGQKIGILYRQSSNWSPGSDAFERVVKAAGGQVVAYPVTINQGNYTQELAQLNTAGIKVVFAWENALATFEMIKQAEGQSYHPAWLVFPFNLETNSLGANALDQPIMGVAAWDAYDPGYYGGGFASYAADIHEFEAEYKKYDSGAQLSGDGGDLLFLNWEAQRQVGDLLRLCGAGCTRNKIAGLLLAGYDRTVSPNCNIDFGKTGDHHHGGFLVNVLEVAKDPNGRANFMPTARCVSSIGSGG